MLLCNKKLIKTFFFQIEQKLLDRTPEEEETDRKQKEYREKELAERVQAAKEARQRQALKSKTLDDLEIKKEEIKQKSLSKWIQIEQEKDPNDKALQPLVDLSIDNVCLYHPQRTTFPK